MFDSAQQHSAKSQLLKSAPILPKIFVIAANSEMPIKQKTATEYMRWYFITLKQGMINACINHLLTYFLNFESEPLKRNRRQKTQICVN